MAKRVEVLVPTDQQEGTESVLATWLKSIGDFVEENEPLIEISTDKAVVEIPAPASGVLCDIKRKPDEKVTPGMLLGEIEVTDRPGKAKKKGPTKSLSQAAAATNEALAQYKGLRISPAVKRMAAKLQVDLNLIKGTGHAGRITKKDLEGHLGRGIGAVQSTTSAKPPEFDTSSIPSKRVPHDLLRRKIAQHMSHSVQVAPHVTSVFQCNLSSIISDRSQKKEDFAKQGAQLTYTAYFVKACVHALKATPEINSRYHESELEIFTDYNIGIGTALEEKGVVVPVIHRAQELDLLGIAEKLTALTEKARAGKLAPQDMANGTFTISNHGVSGSLLASPIIINQPQSAILGIGKVEKRPVVADGSDEVQVQPMAYVTLTIDHRVIDAYQTNKFLSVFVEFLEGY